jgi:hypothetical protein
MVRYQRQEVVTGSKMNVDLLVDCSLAVVVVVLTYLRHSDEFNEPLDTICQKMYFKSFTTDLLSIRLLLVRSLT